jgi:DNA-binding transcriptional MerR regulator
VKYTVKWVEKNIGLTRKALRIYEEKGLMDKSTFQNPDNKYREYSEDDIKIIWFIRVLQGIGYSLNEIVDIAENKEFNLRDSLNEKIIDLERKKNEIEKNIGFAKGLKLFGIIPYPDETGSIKLDDFIKQAREDMNVNTDPQLASLHNVIDIVLSKSELTDDDVKLVDAFLDGYDKEAILKIHDYHISLLEHKDLGITHPTVQSLVNLIFRQYCKYLYPAEFVEITPPQEIAELLTLSYTSGDIGASVEKTYGKDGCKFIAEAIAYFGENSCSSEID